MSLNVLRYRAQEGIADLHLDLWLVSLVNVTILNVRPNLFLGRVIAIAFGQCRWVSHLLTTVHHFDCLGLVLVLTWFAKSTQLAPVAIKKS
jgi:hypothetical protein